MINDVLDKIDRLLVSTLNKRISENPNQTDYIREMTTVAWMKSHCKYDARSPNRSNITGFSLTNTVRAKVMLDRFFSSAIVWVFHAYLLPVEVMDR